MVHTPGHVRLILYRQLLIISTQREPNALLQTPERRGFVSSGGASGRSTSGAYFVAISYLYPFCHVIHSEHLIPITLPGLNVHPQLPLVFHIPA
jgi:hypothetical protein